MKRYILCALLMLSFNGLHAQNDSLWNHKGCAVVLTYDDGLEVDLTNVVPALDSLGLKGTFYISNYAGKLDHQIARWRTAAAEGHELGNHTIYHPCAGNLPGRSFVTADYDLTRYTVRRITDEMRAMNTILKAIDGKTERTFAYPCGDTKVNDTPYFSRMHSGFVAARGVHFEIAAINQVNLDDIGCYAVNGEDAVQLISLVQQAMEKHGLLVFLFHGVGGEHSLNVSLQAHSQLLHFLRAHEKEIWVAPLIDVARYVTNYQEQGQHRGQQR